MKYNEYFPIVEYYKRVIQPLNPSHYRVKSDKMMVCPLHDDVNPSMGLIHGSDGRELYHCFGCNKWGDVVDLHIKASRRLFRKYMTEDEAIKDLCRIFNVDYDKLPLDGTSSKLDADIQKDLAINKAIEKFDISDFRSMILEGKMSGKGISYYNTLMMIMVNEIKEN